uniref:BTB domain-containing protein n=1 Tax=Globodera rostochiensis TaxID=31243 RepID=A0A914HEZ0_GLORO
MEPSKSQSSSTIGGDQQAKNNKYKRSGQIVFWMPKFKEFSEGHAPEKVFSAPVEYINGLPWRIKIKHFCDDYVGIFLKCDGDKTDFAWSCRAAVQFSIVSCKESAECLMKMGILDKFDIYTANRRSWGHKKFVKIEQLMDPENGLYDEEEDAVTFKAEVVAEEPIGMACARFEDDLLINGKIVYVDKNLLAFHSKYFRTLFFGANAEESPNIQIDELSDAVTFFERLICTMYPYNVELDDECVEAVLLLANRFLLNSVVCQCVAFLLKKSKKLAICKFRLARQCGIIGMKNKILEEMTKEDFLIAGAKNFFNIYSEIAKMGAEAIEELRERHEELFGTE